MTQAELQALIAPLTVHELRQLRDLLDESLEAKAIVEAHPEEDQPKYPLRGTIIHYDEPFEPVALEDWEALK